MAATVAALLFLVLPVISVWLLFRRVRVSGNRAVQILAALILYAFLQLFPVHLLAALEIAAVISKVTVLQLVSIQVLFLLAIIIVTFFLPAVGLNTFQTSVANSETIRLPRYILASAAIVVGSYLVFAVDLLSSYPTGWDALSYHIPLSLRWLQEGSLRISSSHVWQFSMPANAEIGMMILLATGRQALVPLVNWLALIVLALASYLIAVRCCRDGLAAFTAVLILLSIPPIQFQTFSAYVDLYGTAFMIAAVALFLYRHDCTGRNTARKYRPMSLPLLAISALACGIAVGTKPIYYVYCALYVLAVLYVLARERSRHGSPLPLLVLLVGAGIFLPSAFWFGRAIQATGNPVYPLEVAIGGYTIFEGYASITITAPDFDKEFVRSRPEWLIYPWTEWKRNTGYLLIPYGSGSGLGGAFATFVPLGLAFAFYKSYLRNRNGNPSERVHLKILIFLLLLMSVVWWFWLLRMPRFGMPLLVLACVLSAPLLARFIRSGSHLFRWLLLASVFGTCLISGFVPLHSILGRIRSGDWTRAWYYSYPKIIDALPEGSRVVNKTLSYNNFALAGERLTNKVITHFEARGELGLDFLRENRVDFVIESFVAEQDSQVLDSQLPRLGKVVYDKVRDVGESGRRERWRIWKVTPDEGSY